MIFSTVVRITPRPQPRPRFAGSGHVYEPMDITAYKSTIAQSVRLEMLAGKVDKVEAKIPLSLSIDFAMPVPKSWSNARRSAALLGYVEPTSRPDLDNLIKAVKDALNGVLWDDDSQVTHYGRMRKHYSEHPAVFITVTTQEVGHEAENRDRSERGRAACWPRTEQAADC